MAKEIERKFLIKEEKRDYLTPVFFDVYPSVTELKNDVLKNGKPIKQGYLPLDGKSRHFIKSIGFKYSFNLGEIRLRDKNGKYYMTLKSDGGLKRNELEKEVSDELFSKHWVDTAGRRIEKVRLDKKYLGHTLEIDVYTDRELITAEVEFNSVKEADKMKPIGKDITNDSNYKNKNLAK